MEMPLKPITRLIPIRDTAGDLFGAVALERNGDRHIAAIWMRGFGASTKLIFAIQAAGMVGRALIQIHNDWDGSRRMITGMSAAGRARKPFCTGPN